MMGRLRNPAAAPGPSRKLVWLNFGVFQIVWMGAVLSAAHGEPLLGCGLIALAVAWHLKVAPAPRQEIKLIALVSLIGLAFECLRMLQADVIYPSGQPVDWLPAYWLIALWALLATTLNLSLRWLHAYPGISAFFGLFGGPLAFMAGARLGAATFVNQQQALLSLAVGWFVLMPALVRLSRRCDGFAPQGAA